MDTILVTGGAGFIGTHTCLTLLQKGYKVIVLDSFINSKSLAIERVKEICRIHKINHKEKFNFVQGDLKDINIIYKTFRNSELEGFPINSVIHLAGLKAVHESIQNPLLYWDNNLIGTINLLKIMDAQNCRTLVFSSSATIYGYKSDEIIKENDLINPINPYGNTKNAIEKILFDIFQSSNEKWKIINLRYFNPIGAHHTGLIGEEPKGIPNNIFPIILKVAAGIMPKLKIYGKNWPTVDGTGVRDYIHVMDLAEAHIASLEYLSNSDNKQMRSLNLGTGKGTSVLQLINCFEAVNKVKVPYEIVDKRKGDVASVIADNYLAISLLKWLPKRDLKQMCLDGWKWEINNPKGYEN